MSDDTEETVQPAGGPGDTKQEDVRKQHRDKGGVTLPEDPKQ